MSFNAKPEQVREQIHLILQAWGMTDDLAATTADVMLETDLIGVDSHGISMLMTYERSAVRAGSTSRHDQQSSKRTRLRR